MQKNLKIPGKSKTCNKNRCNSRSVLTGIKLAGNDLLVTLEAHPSQITDTRGVGVVTARAVYAAAVCSFNRAQLSTKR